MSYRGRPTEHSASILDYRILRTIYLFNARPGMTCNDLRQCLAIEDRKSTSILERRLQFLHSQNLLTYAVTISSTPSGCALFDRIHLLLKHPQQT